MSRYDDEVREAEERVRKFTRDVEENQREFVEVRAKLEKSQRDLTYWKDELPIRQRRKREEDERERQEEEERRRFNRAA